MFRNINGPILVICLILHRPVAYRAELSVLVLRLPDVDALVLRAGYDVLAVVAERCLDLGGRVQVALVLAAQVQVAQIVQPDAAVVGGDQNFVLAWKWDGKLGRDGKGCLLWVSILSCYPANVSANGLLHRAVRYGTDLI